MEQVEGQEIATYYVCILRCADDSFYVGSAQNLDAREKAHNAVY